MPLTPTSPRGGGLNEYNRKAGITGDPKFDAVAIQEGLTNPKYPKVKQPGPTGPFTPNDFVKYPSIKKEQGPLPDGGLAEPGFYDNGDPMGTNPFQPPLGGGYTTRDLTMWMNQFTKGTAAWYEANFAIDEIMGTGANKNKIFDPRTGQWIDDPDNTPSEGPTSSFGDVIEMPDGSFRVVPNDESHGQEGTQETSSTAGGTEGQGLSNEDLLGEVEKMVSGMDFGGQIAAERANTATLLADQAADFKSQMDRMMMIVSGLQNTRREDEDRFGSLSYSPLYGGR